MIPVLMNNKGRIFGNSEHTMTQTGQKWAYNIGALNHRYELFKIILVVADMKYSDGREGITSKLYIMVFTFCARHTVTNRYYLQSFR
jgi:hypothetical protein